jgi:multiple sugar transport system permease protein
MLATLGVTIIWAFPLVFAILATTTQMAGGEAGIGVYLTTLVSTPIGRWYLNSLVTSAGVTLGVLAISATCGFALSQLQFRGRRVLWGAILLSFMIPVQALIVNHFFLMHRFGLINSWLGVILPQLIAPVAVIVYKRFFDSVPKDYREAAELDGAGPLRVLVSIYLPLNWGVTAALGIITFIGAWNAFLWPFLVVTKPEMMTITVAISEAQDSWGVSGLAAALLAGLPVAVLYLIFQRRVTEAIMLSSGVKG